MTISEKLRLIMRRRGLTITALASAIGISRQYLTTKLKKNNFTVAELERIAGLLNCTFDSGFIMNDTGEKV